VDKIPDVVSKTLDQLSQRFGATGLALWKVYVNFIEMDALSNVLGILIFGLICLYAAHKYTPKMMTYEEDASNVKLFVWIVFGAILGFTIACNFATICSPGGYAVYTLINH